jgi:hypothetical protein
VLDVGAVGAVHGDEQCDRDAGEGRVHARSEESQPRHDRERYVHGAASSAEIARVKYTPMSPAAAIRSGSGVKFSV